MATIIHGSNGTADINIDSKSYQCSFGRWTADITRGFEDATTFCSEEWVEETPVRKQLFGSATGFATKGTDGYSPAVGMSVFAGVPIVLTADTGCTYTFAGHIGRSRIGMVAMANSELAIDFRSTGPVTIAWALT